MCIRDSHCTVAEEAAKAFEQVFALRDEMAKLNHEMETRTCLLYTSDAADERSSVDLGGRRIIKKKKKAKT